MLRVHPHTQECTRATHYANRVKHRSNSSHLCIAVRGYGESVWERVSERGRVFVYVCMLGRTIPKDGEARRKAGGAIEGAYKDTEADAIEGTEE